MAKKYLPSLILLFGLILALPMTVSAAPDDVQFTNPTNAQLTSPNTVLVVGAGAQGATFAVTPGNVQIGLEAGSSITITSAARYILQNSLVTTNCAANTSSITINYTVGPNQVITVTPSGTCPVGGTGGPGPTGGAPPAAAAVTGTVTVSPAAGGSTTATSAEGNSATVSVPAGAVSVNTVVNVTPVTSGTVTPSAPPPAGNFLVGNYVYNITASATGVGAVTTFAQSVTLTFTYTDTQIAGLNESNLTVSRWDGTQWVVLPSTVNTVTNTITATTNAFSYFAIMGKSAAVVVPPAKPIAEMTVEELKAEIARIATLIAQLQAELNKLLGGAQPFTADLSSGTKGNSEVKRLQEFLISKGYLESGFNTGNYLSLTVQAVKDYQTAKGITPVAGYFGPKTRAAVNADLGVSQ
jgi:hypothetical protein